MTLGCRGLNAVVALALILLTHLTVEAASDPGTTRNGERRSFSSQTLGDLGLHKYTPLFEREEITNREAFLLLKEKDLDKLGLPMGPKLMILDEQKLIAADKDDEYDNEDEVSTLISELVPALVREEVDQMQMQQPQQQRPKRRADQHDGDGHRQLWLKSDAARMDFGPNAEASLALSADTGALATSAGFGVAGDLAVGGRVGVGAGAAGGDAFYGSRLHVDAAQAEAGAAHTWAFRSTLATAEAGTQTDNTLLAVFGQLETRGTWAQEGGSPQLAVKGQVLHGSTGGVADVRAVEGRLHLGAAAGTVARGVMLSAEWETGAGTTVTDLFGVKVANVGGTEGTETNAYGLHIGAMHGATTSYGIYQESGDDANFFAGDVALGKALSLGGSGGIEFGAGHGRWAIEKTNGGADLAITRYTASESTVKVRFGPAGEHVAFEVKQNKDGSRLVQVAQDHFSYFRMGLWSVNHFVWKPPKESGSVDWLRADVHGMGLVLIKGGCGSGRHSSMWWFKGSGASLIDGMEYTYGCGSIGLECCGGSNLKIKWDISNWEEAGFTLSCLGDCGSWGKQWSAYREYGDNKQGSTAWGNNPECDNCPKCAGTSTPCVHDDDCGEGSSCVW